MKIYFTGTSQNEEDRPIYRRIVDFLEKEDHEVFSEVLSEHLPDLSSVSNKMLKDWQKEWSSYITECDFALVEGSYPSTIHIGFEVGTIISRGKPVVVVFIKGRDPIFLNRFSATRLVKSEYDEDNLEEVLRWGISEVERLSSRRFTFYISSKIDQYLSEVVEDTGGSRSEYIRRLIEQEMEEGS